MTDLPGELEGIAEIVGRGTALDLAEALGGRDIRVPRPSKLHEGHPLVKVVGREAAMRLAEVYTGEQLYIPKANKAVAQRLLNAGMSTAAVAAKLGVTRSSVRRYGRETTR